LMYNYMQTVARTAAYKAAAKYPALESVKRRDDIERDMGNLIVAALQAEKLDTYLTVTKVQVRNIQPAQSIIDTANEAIAAQNQLMTVTKQVAIAEQEAKRQAFLSQPENIKYMAAKAELNYSEAALAGKINMMIVPRNFTSVGNLAGK